MEKKINEYNNKKLSETGETIFNYGKYTGKTFQHVYENNAQYTNWINKQQHLKKSQYSSFRDSIKQREFIKIDESKDKESKTIEETYINPTLEENIMNGDYSWFVNDRKEEKEYNGDVYKIRTF